MSVSVGDRAETTRTVTEALLEHFAEATGDRNPIHFDEDYAAATRFRGRIAHGLLVGGVISSLLANELPGPGTVYLGQELSFRAPVRIGDEVRCEVEVTEVGERGRVTLATRAWVGDTLVVDGVARVLAPG
ncbi:MAG TPA: MaoC family dehydratase [Gaiellales bacterium]|nr:MaoC family dehydratase [Gaiellales bacterium]